MKNAVLQHPFLHADETLVAVLKLGTKKTHRAYLCAYAPMRLCAYGPMGQER